MINPIPRYKPISYQKTPQSNKIIVENILTNEQFDNYCKAVEIDAEKAIQESHSLLQKEKLKCERENKKIQKMIQSIIDDLTSTGKEIPARLTNILKSLK